MQFSPRFDRGKKQFKTVVWLDLSKVGSVRTQVAKQRCVIGRDSLSNHCNPEPAHWKRFDGNRSLKAIPIVSRRLAKGIQLMRSPEICRFLFDKLGRVIDPVEPLQLGRKGQHRERMNPLADLSGGERAKTDKFLVNLLALRREFEVILDQFPQQAREKAQGKLLKHCQVGNSQLPCLRRISGKLIGFEVVWQHKKIKAVP